MHVHGKAHCERHIYIKNCDSQLFAKNNLVQAQTKVIKEQQSKLLTVELSIVI